MTKYNDANGKKTSPESKVRTESEFTDVSLRQVVTFDMYLISFDKLSSLLIIRLLFNASS
jgi:hypothetical protein